MKRALLLALFLAACSAPKRSADWFAAHPDELSRVLYRCETGQQTDAECDAAHAAQRAKADARLKSFRKGF